VDRVRRAAVRGEITRLRQSVYATPGAHPLIVRAAILGGRVAGATAAPFHHLWAPPDVPFTIELSRSAKAPGAADVAVMWTREPRSLSDSLGLAPFTDTIRQIALSQPAHFVVAVLDSALRASGITRVELEAIALSVPPRLRWPFRVADARSDSGTESVARALLLADGIAAVPQVRVPFTDLERLDLLVGDRLVVECDSAEHHGSAGQRVRDLRRDAALAALGFIVVRFDYRQILFEPAALLAAVHGYVSRGLHRDPGRTQ
jgi:very-short-patch-repair endonuclease